jgi:SpoVK/Ycf46/Vps4 family AAA+-type ATPase
MGGTKNQWDTDLKAQNEKIREELVQVVRFAAKGDVERVRIQAMRFIRMLRASADPFADALQAAAFPEEAPNASVRGVRRATTMEISRPVPADKESQLDLLRVEDPPVLPHPMVQAESVMARISQIVAERKSLAKLSKLGLPPAKAILFTGPPGVGKTMAARHIARELGLPLLVLDLAAVISSYLGQTGNNIKQSFNFARGRKCVFFLDEIDAVAKKRDDNTDVGELKRLVTVLLQEIDLWSPDNILLAATNHSQLLDTAIWRRFDEVIPFPRPTPADLMQLSSRMAHPNDPMPAAWAVAVAMLSGGTSQSDFVRDLARVRRGWAVGGKGTGVQSLKDLATERVDKLDKQSRKELAAILIRDAGLSQRDASRVADIARETLRTFLEGNS